MIETFTLSFPNAKEFPFWVEKKVIDNDYVEHFHDFTEINVFIHGSACQIINGIPVEIKAGDTFVFNPGSSHGFCDAKSLTLYQVMYHPKHLITYWSPLQKMSGYQALFLVERSRTEGSTVPNHFSLSMNRLNIVTGMFEGMIKEFHAKSEGYEAFLQASLMQLVVFLSRAYAKSEPRQDNTIIRVAQIAAYIEKNFTESFTLDQLSSMSGVSKWQLMRDFKNYFDTTPLSYIQHLRIKHAIELMRNTNRSITEIAYACGFSDSNYFTRIFTRTMGTSPGRYRNQVFLT